MLSSGFAKVAAVVTAPLAAARSCSRTRNSGFFRNASFVISSSVSARPADASASRIAAANFGNVGGLDIGKWRYGQCQERPALDLSRREELSGDRAWADHACAQSLGKLRRMLDLTRIPNS